MIACAVGVAYLLPAYSAYEEAEFGLCLVQFLAATAIVLVSIAWNLLLDLTRLTVYDPKLSWFYTGGMKGTRGWITMPLGFKWTTEPLYCDGLILGMVTCGRLFCWASDWSSACRMNGCTFIFRSLSWYNFGWGSCVWVMRSVGETIVFRIVSFIYFVWVCSVIVWDGYPLWVGSRACLGVGS